MRIAVAAVIAGLAVALAPDAHATAVGCRAHVAPGVVVNHCTNHGYYQRSLDFSLRHAAAGLAVARRRLVRAGSIADRPVLFELPAFAEPGPARIEKRASCARDTADGEDVAEELGPCYRIVSGARDYLALRSLLAALPGLSADDDGLEIVDVTALPASPSLDGVSIDGSATAAPGGRFAVRERWRDGALSLDLLQKGRGLRALPALRSYLAATPIWSSDGVRVAYASLDEVLVHEAAKNETWRFDLGAELELGIRPNQVLLAFRGAELLAAADTDLFSRYRSWSIDLTAARGRFLGEDDAAPAWSSGP
jgi:hypothetical protein